jgi:hypothetical protein
MSILTESFEYNNVINNYIVRQLDNIVRQTDNAGVEGGCGMFKLIKHKKKFEQVLDQIKDLLLTKRLKIRQKMPSEIELSETWA